MRQFTVSFRTLCMPILQINKQVPSFGEATCLSLMLVCEVWTVIDEILSGNP
jgi:hypothetical protein